MTRVDGRENPNAEATTLAEDVGLQRAHPPGIDLLFRSGIAISDRHRRRAAAEAQLSDGEAM